MKTNTTLTDLDLTRDDKIEKEIQQRNENMKWNDNKYNKWNENNENYREKTTITNENEQRTILEIQERQQ